MAVKFVYFECVSASAAPAPAVAAAHAGRAGGGDEMRNHGNVARKMEMAHRQARARFLKITSECRIANPVARL
jgi:hypothetical protein